MFISDAIISYHTIKVCPVKYLLLHPEGTSACCTVETKNSIVESIQVINIVSNNAKRQISKRVFQEKKACQNFWKTNIPYPLYAHVRIGGKKCSFFGKFSILFFGKFSNSALCWNTCFEIRRFALLLMILMTWMPAQTTLLRVKNKMNEFIPHFTLPYFEEIWCRFNSAQGKNEIFGVDLIWHS